MKEIKVRVKREYPNIKEILPLNFETKLIPVYQEKDEVIFPEQRYEDKKTGNETVVPAAIRYAGTLKYLKFEGANGNTYSDDILRNFIGYVPLSDIFDKL